MGAWSRANIIRQPGHLQGCGRLGDAHGGVRGEDQGAHGAWPKKMAWTPTGVWQIEDVHGGASWMPMGWPGHLRGGVAD